MMGNGLLTRTKEEHSNKDRLRYLELNVFSVNPDSGHISKVFLFHELKNLFVEKDKSLEDVLTLTLSLNELTLEEASRLLNSTLKAGNTIFWCGNGGSASESSHLATELVGRFKENIISLPSISLNTATSALTCIANDYGYEEIFAIQLQGLSRPGDLLAVLSTSGSSPNILKVLELAHSQI